MTSPTQTISNLPAVTAPATTDLFMVDQVNPQSPTGYTTRKETAAQIATFLSPGVTTFNTRTGDVTLEAADVTGVGGALLDSPALTGTPTATTASPGSNTTRIATTAFVAAAVSPLAPTVSPVLTGTPTAPTPPAGDDSTKICTTEFVAAFNTNAGQNRNRIINGNFLFDQWNASAIITPAADQYIADRWKTGALTQSSKFTSRVMLSANVGVGIPALKCLQLKAASSYTSLATDALAVLTSLEWQSVADLGWGTASALPGALSFWAYASGAGIYSGSIRNNGGTRSYPFSFSLEAATPAYVTVQVPGDTGGVWSQTAADLGWFLSFDLGSGATFRGPANAWASANYTGVTGTTSLVAANNATLTVTNVQFEAGLNSTPFEFDSPSVVLSKCQRYFERSYEYGISTGAVTPTGQLLVYTAGMPSAAYTSGTMSAFKVTKRAVPKITMYSPATGASGKIRDQTNLADITPTVAGYSDGVQWFGTMAAPNTAINLSAHYIADAEL